MQRGILELTVAESILAVKAIQETGVNLDSLLRKLNMAIIENQPVSIIEVNREEVETLMDNLPMPNNQENHNYKVLRNKLANFVRKEYE